MKNTFVWLSIFFSFFFTKICSMTLLWSITIMILFCFCCLSICCLPQYTCTYVYKFTLALSHFHCCHSRHTVPYNYYTYKLGSYGCTTRGSRLTPILYTLPRTKRWVREFRMGMLCVYVWVCKVCISNRLLCFILLCFFFHPWSSMVQILHTFCLQLLKYTICDLICII